MSFSFPDVCRQSTKMPLLRGFSDARVGDRRMTFRFPDGRMLCAHVFMRCRLVHPNPSTHRGRKTKVVFSLSFHPLHNVF